MAIQFWLGAPTSGFAQCQWSPTPRLGVVDGAISAIRLDGETIFLGGQFHYAGPRTGAAAVFEGPTWNRQRQFPFIDGTVYAIEPDGRGGWFVGGEFQRVDGLAATNLIHVTSDQRWDRAWNIAMVGTAVYALAVDAEQDRLYVGGQFQRVRGEAHRSLAVVTAAGGELVPWTTAVNGSVYALRLTSNALLVAGQFSTLGGESRDNGGMVDATTGEVGTWNPAADRAILCLQTAEGYAYVGGTFTTIGGKPRNRLAALSLETGLASNWNPNPNGQVRSLAVEGDLIFVGGDFTSIGAKSRRGFAAVNRSSGAATALDIGIDGSGTPQNLVWAIRVQGGTVYVAGSFSQVRGQSQPMLAAVDVATGNPVAVPLATRFNGARDDAWIGAMALVPGRWVVGGSLASVGGSVRQHAAAFSLVSGEVLDWDPAPDHGVLAMAQLGDALFLGGTFTNCGGAEMRGVAKVDRELGWVDPAWVSGITNRTDPYQVRSLLVSQDGVLAVGLFDGSGTEARRWIASLDARNGAVLPFQANVKGGSSGISAAARQGDLIAIAGDFTSVGNQARTRLAAVRADTGEVLPWNPSPNRAVSALVMSGDRLYVGGEFTRIAGLDLRLLAVFELPSLELLPWDAALSTGSSSVQAMVATDTVIYLAGDLDAVGGEFRTRLAALVPSSAQSMDWNPAPDQVPVTLALSDRWVALGGSVRSVAGDSGRQSVAFHAVWDRKPRLTATRTAAGKMRWETTTGDRSRAVLQNSTNLKTWHPVSTNAESGYRWSAEIPTDDGPQTFYQVIAE
ncbi:MAG: hypothetical protein JNK85_01540 [Verrucomicrobiales bacterium]|nr:hypothetical protein [Verrucomicrobiales bacterium]